jgi:hypothetical protein
MSNEYDDGEIRFSSGKNYMLLIHTDKYSGNFEREMAGYVIGAHDEDRGHGFAEAEQFKNDGENDPRFEAMTEKIGTQTHAEYGDVSNTIWPTPGWLNNGCGHMLTVAEFEATYPGQKGCAAYQSVAIFLSEPLTAEELEIVAIRAKEFGEANYDDYRNKPDPITVSGVEQILVEVKTSVVTMVVTTL